MNPLLPLTLLGIPRVPPEPSVGSDRMRWEGRASHGWMVNSLRTCRVASHAPPIAGWYSS